MQALLHQMLQDLRDLWDNFFCPIGRFFWWPWALAGNIVAFDPLKALAAFVVVFVAGAAQWVFLATIVAAVAKWPEPPADVMWMIGGATVVYVALTLVFHRPEKEKDR